MALQDKYKGKSFAKVAEEINNTYKDRFDPISIRGLNSEMKSLEEAQEYIKQKQAIEAKLEAEQQQAMQQPQQTDGLQQQGQVQAVPPTAGNEGVGFNPTQPQETFKREASSDYNEKFAEGGNMYEYGGALGLALQAAPLLIDGLQLGQMEEAAPTDRHTVNGDILSSLANFKPRQSKFENIDFDNIERGMVEGSAKFTQNNVNASKGNAGSFMANELANSASLTESIGKARMGAQVEDRKTDQLNAAEVARVDTMKFQKGFRLAGLNLNLAKHNSNVNTRADDVDAMNLAAYESAKSDRWSSIAANVGTIGKTLFDNARLSKTEGYNILGNFMGGSESEQDRSIAALAKAEKISKDEARELLIAQAAEADKNYNDEIDRYQRGEQSFINSNAKGGKMSSVLKSVRKKK